MEYAINLENRKKMNNTIHLRVDSETKNRLVKQARDARLPLSTYIRILLDKTSLQVSLESRKVS